MKQPFERKIKTYEEFLELHEDHRAYGLQTGICVGCFDIIHIGHILHLLEAQDLCDTLFVMVTPDTQVDKGHTRPVFPEKTRCKQVAAIEPVDFVCVRPSGTTAQKSLSRMKPEIYFKGADYREKQSEELQAEILTVKKAGGAVFYTKAPIQYHSTDIISLITGRD